MPLGVKFKKIVKVSSFVAAALFLVRVAEAHPFHGSTFGFATGFLHPLTGLDHLFASLAVGLWAGQRGGVSRWALPLGFLAVVAVGTIFGSAGFRFSLAEPEITLSLIFLGIAVARSSKLSLVVSLPVVALFAFGHGYAHGSEIPVNVAAFAYFGGLVTATALTLATGVALAQVSKESWVRVAGAGIAGAALVIAAT